MKKLKHDTSGRQNFSRKIDEHRSYAILGMFVNEIRLFIVEHLYWENLYCNNEVVEILLSGNIMFVAGFMMWVFAS